MSMHSKASLVFTLTVLFILYPAFIQAAVLKVGPGEPFTDIKDACLAASDNDILLVQAGVYSAFKIDGKGITVAAEPGALVEIQSHIRVVNLGADQNAALHGLSVKIYTPDYNGLRIQANLGSVRVEDCIFKGDPGWYSPGWAGAMVLHCADVAFTRCTCTGGYGMDNYEDAGSPTPGGTGLHVEYSCVTLYDCLLKGGGGGWDDADNNGADGGNGCYLRECDLFASGCTFQGGRGGNSGWDVHYDLWGGDGGDGLYCHGIHDKVILLDCTCVGGEGGGGFPYDGSPGHPWYVYSGGMSTLTELVGRAQHFEMPAVVRELEKVDLLFQGSPDAQIYLFLSPGPGSLYLHSMLGQWLLAFSPLLQHIPLGTLSGFGTLTVPATIPDMGPGFDGVNIYLQPVIAEDSGQLILGPPCTLVVVGDQY
jgi:hypothetical protein